MRVLNVEYDDRGVIVTWAADAGASLLDAGDMPPMSFAFTPDPLDGPLFEPKVGDREFSR